MKAVVYAGPDKVKVDDVDEPSIQEPTDAIVRVRRSAICGSDLHALNGKTPGMQKGGIIGHEFVGIIRELGEGVVNHHEDTRVVGSFLIACGQCRHCQARRFNFCVNRRALGLGSLTGDLAGAQAELVRVPNADINLKLLSGGLSGLSDEDALFGGDIFTTGFYAASLADLSPDDSVVIVGAGPVGLCCAIACRRMTEKVAVLDADAGRVAFAKKLGIAALPVTDDNDAQAVINDASGGRMADVTIEAVGSSEAFKTTMKCVRDGGRVVVVGVYGMERYELPMGMVWVRGLDLRFAGMANIQAHWEDALLSVAKGETNPSQLITHRLPLEEAKEGYELFRSKQAMKVVFEL